MAWRCPYLARLQALLFDIQVLLVFKYATTGRVKKQRKLVAGNEPAVAHNTHRGLKRKTGPYRASGKGGGSRDDVVYYDVVLQKNRVGCVANVGCGDARIANFGGANCFF